MQRLYHNSERNLQRAHKLAYKRAIETNIPYCEENGIRTGRGIRKFDYNSRKKVIETKGDYACNFIFLF